MSEFGSGRNVLVSGASGGLGLETALYLAARGFRVYAGVRDDTKRTAVLEAAEEHQAAVSVVQLDLTEPESINAAVDAVVAECGGIYGLVNNAGIGPKGCFEDMTDAEMRAIFETNLFGTMAVTRRVLSHMRAAGRGRIVTITSVGGRIATFGLSGYCASKFALEGWGEALALEVAPFGIRSILVEPGIVDTGYWARARATAVTALDPSSPYHTLFQNHEELTARLVARSRNRPADVAEVVYEALTAGRPRLRYVAGAPASVVVTLRRYLPDRLFEWLYFGSLVRHIVRGVNRDSQADERGYSASIGRS